MSDRRIKKTEDVLENSLFELLEQYSLPEISITKLCNKANINRSTFYLHYMDLEDFYDHLELKMVNLFLECSDHYHYDTDVSEMLDLLFQMLIDNQKLFAFMFRKESKGLFQKTLSEKLYQRTLPHWKEESDLSEEQIKIIFVYLSDGMKSILQYWYESGFRLDVYELKDIMENLVKYGVYNYIYTK